MALATNRILLKYKICVRFFENSGVDSAQRTASARRYRRHERPVEPPSGLRPIPVRNSPKGETAVQLTLEIVRSTEAQDPFAFAVGEQDYVLRTPLGGAERLSLRWDAELLADLAALRRPGRDPALPQRIGDLLRRFLSTTYFAQAESELLVAIARGETVTLTLRLAAAELFALPWELLTLSGSGLHLGALPDVLLRYAWPDTRSQTWPLSDEGYAQEGGRVLFAWSAAGGAVPAAEHQAALAAACLQAALPFDETSDLLPAVSLGRLAQLLRQHSDGPATRMQPVVLHILCHGLRHQGSFGLAWDRDDGSAPQVVDAGALRQVLAPHAAQLRLVVLMACDSGNSGPLGNHLGSVAQALHRAGIATVLASRYPLSVSGSLRLSQTLYPALLGQPFSLETAFRLARSTLLSEAGSLDWAALQLYARPEDGDDTRPLPFRPYRGLSTFSAKDSRFFFGRTAERHAVRQRLLQLAHSGRPRLLVVTGASGSGKSSVVLAGLVPDLLGSSREDERDARLRRTASELLQLLPDDAQAAGSPTLRAALVTLRSELSTRSHAASAGPFECAVLRPGSNPQAALQRALAGRRDAARPFLLVVDQFEELFTHVRDERERSAFSQALWALSRGPDGIHCVVTLRVDFVGRCGELSLDEHGLLFDRIVYDDEHRVFIAQPGPEQLAEAIAEPARRSGLYIAPSLVQRMVADVVGEPGALPLLSYVLDQLWQARRGRELSESAYSQLGGVAGALGGSADRVYDALSPADQTLARQILVRLVRFSDEAGGETRLRRSLSELHGQLSSAGPRLDAVLATFVEARLLVRSEEGDAVVIEVAHEALIRRWPRLQSFLHSDRQRLLEARELSGWASQFAAFGTLLRGAQLGYAQRLLEKYGDELGRNETRLIQASQRAQRRRFLQTLLAASAVIVSLVFLSLRAQHSAAQATKEKRLAQQKERTAQARLLSRLAEQATASHPDRALLLSAHAVQLGSEPSTRSALFGALQRSAALHRFLSLPPPPSDTNSAAAATARAHSLTYTRDGRVLLAAAGSAGLLVFDAEEGRRLAQYQPRLATGRPAALYAAVASPDGQIVAAAGDGGSVFLFPLPPGTSSEQRVVTPARSLYSLEFRGDGLQLAAGSGDGQVLFIDVPKLRVTAERATGAAQIVAGLAYAPGHGARLAAVGNSGALVVLDAATSQAAVPPAPALGPLPGGHGYLSSVAWLDGGRQVAAASEDGGVLRWDSVRGERLAPLLSTQVGALSAIGVSADGQLFLACGLDGRLHVQLLGPKPDREPPLLSPGGPLDSCAIRPDGQQLASGSDGQILLWDMRTHPLWHRRRHPLPAASLWASPDGKELLIGDVEGGLRRWHLSQARPEAPQSLHSRALQVMAGSRDGSALATGSADGSIAVLHGPRLQVRHSALRLSGAHGAVTALAVSPMGSLLAAGYADGTLAWFDLRQGTLRGAPVASQQQAITALLYSLDGERVYSGGFDGSLRVFDAGSGQRLCEPAKGTAPPGHHDTLTSLAVHPQADLLASSGRDQRIVLWTLSDPTQGGGEVGCPRRLGEPLQPHQAAINSVQFSADGTLLASGGDDAQVWVTDVQRRQPLGQALRGHRRAIHSVAFAPSGILFSADDETVYRWDTRESTWQSTACERAGRNLSLSEWQQAMGDAPYCRVCPQHAPGPFSPALAPPCSAAAQPPNAARVD